MTKSLVFLVLSLFSVAPLRADVPTDQPNNVDEAGALEDQAYDIEMRDYYSGTLAYDTVDEFYNNVNGTEKVTSTGNLPGAVQAGVAFRAALEKNKATADAIAQARAELLPAATKEISKDGQGKCWKFIAEKQREEIPCNAAALTQNGPQYVGTSYLQEEHVERTWYSDGSRPQNKPYYPPKK